MIRLAIVVEGETETVFVKQTLVEHLLAKGVDTNPISLDGNVSVERLADRMAKLFWTFDRVTSLVDFYGFQHKGSASVTDLEGQIHGSIMRRLNRPVDESRIIPYVQRHEFESLLFSDVRAFATLPDVTGRSVDLLDSIHAAFENPEEINDSSSTAPSKRITRAIPRYDKVRDGPPVALAIGLAAIRRECPRFNQWVERLESLG